MSADLKKMIWYPTLDKDNEAKTFELVKGSSYKRTRPDAEEKYAQNIEGLHKFKNRQFVSSNSKYRIDQSDWQFIVCGEENPWNV